VIDFRVVGILVHLDMIVVAEIRRLTGSPALAIVEQLMSRTTSPRALHAVPSAGSTALVSDDLAGVARAAALGDPDAASTLVLHLGGGILRIVRKVLGPSHPDVDDVAQEAVMAALDALQRFRGESSVAHFVHRVALHAALGARRKLNARMRAAQREALPLDDVVDPGGNPHVEVLARRRRDAVLALLDELSPPVAEALALHFMLGHSVEDIARASGLSVHTVWSRLRLGKQALRRRLRGKLSTPDHWEVEE
jgi:RNA polymerase sigma-70 factor (ECF subfamily)